MGVVLVLPTSTAGQLGPVAAYVSTAGWAAAAAGVTGASWVVTPSGVVDPADARRAGSAADLASRSEPTGRSRVPTVVKTAVKDLRSYRRARAFRVDRHGPWSGRPVEFVWQRHELFVDAGARLAGQLGVPSVVFVPATAVWEARRWGVRRPGWGGPLERVGEGRILRRADLVACGAPEVAEQVARLGVDPDRTLITPTGVDLDLFDHGADRAAVRDRLGLGDRFVIGWTGSFRPFHALDRLVTAVEGLDAVLLLVGDGPERPRIAALAEARGVPAVFTGTVAHADLPAHLAAMDAAVVVPPADSAFHYSPLKLAEYLAAGLPVVAPDLEPVNDRLTHGADALLVPPADPAALRDALARLRDDAGLAERLRAGARRTRQQFSWDEQVRRVVAALDAWPAAGHSG